MRFQTFKLGIALAGAVAFANAQWVNVQERFHRRDFGHMDVQATVEGPNVLTKPVTIKFTELRVPNSDILENFCTEGKRDRVNMPTGDFSRRLYGDTP